MISNIDIAKNKLGVLMDCENARYKFISTFAELQKNKKILDVGCNTGKHTILFCKGENEVSGVDLINVVKKEYGNFKFVLANAARLPFENESFDLIVNFDVLEHIEEDADFLKEALRVLKSGGEILMMTPNRLRLSHRLRELTGKKITYPLYIGTWPGLGDVVHVREYTRDQLMDLMTSAGFKEIKVLPFWLGIFMKYFGFGLTRFPKVFDSLAQYWIIAAKKE